MEAPPTPDQARDEQRRVRVQERFELLQKRRTREFLQFVKTFSVDHPRENILDYFLVPGNDIVNYAAILNVSPKVLTQYDWVGEDDLLLSGGSEHSAN